MLKGPYLNTEYIGMYLDSDNEALKSRKIREAINLGFDRKLMVAFLRNNIGYALKKDLFQMDFLVQVKQILDTIQ